MIALIYGWPWVMICVLLVRHYFWMKDYKERLVKSRTDRDEAVYAGNIRALEMIRKLHNMKGH